MCIFFWHKIWNLVALLLSNSVFAMFSVCLPGPDTVLTLCILAHLASNQTTITKSLRFWPSFHTEILGNLLWLRRGLGYAILKRCHFGIRIVLSWRQLWINRCRKDYPLSHYLPKARFAFPFEEDALVVPWREGWLLLQRGSWRKDEFA